MADSGLLRLLFLTANLLFWVCQIENAHKLVGGGLLGFVGWTLSTLPNTSGFMSGSFLILYAGIAIGLLISLDGLLGCLGGMFGSMLLLKIYLGLSVMFGVVEIAVIMAVYVEKEEIPSILNSTWHQINDEARYTIQKSLKCCGIDSYTVYGSDYAEFPDSCFKVSKIFGTVVVKQESTLYTTSCLSAMQTWLKENMAIWIAVLISIAIIQIISGMLSCQVHTRLHDIAMIHPVHTEKEKEKEIKEEVDEQQEMNDFESVKGDRNMDGASCNSTSTFENESHDRSNVGVIVTANSNNANDTKSDEKSLNDKQFEYKSEPRLNDAVLDETLFVNEHYFGDDEKNKTENEVNVKNEYGDHKEILDNGDNENVNNIGENGDLSIKNNILDNGDNENVNNIGGNGDLSIKSNILDNGDNENVENIGGNGDVIVENSILDNGDNENVKNIGGNGDVSIKNNKTEEERSNTYDNKDQENNAPDQENNTFVNDDGVDDTVCNSPVHHGCDGNMDKNK